LSRSPPAADLLSIVYS